MHVVELDEAVPKTKMEVPKRSWWQHKRQRGELRVAAVKLEIRPG